MPTPETLSASLYPARIAVVTSHPVQYQAPLFQYLTAHGFDLTVYYAHDDSLVGAIDPEFGVPVTWDRPLMDGYRSVVLTSKRSAAGKTSAMFARMRLVRDLARRSYDAVFIHSYATSFSLAGYVGAWLSSAPVLLRTESEMIRPRHSSVQLAKDLLLRWLFRHTGAFLAIGKANVEFYRHYGVPADRLFMTPYCVDNDFFDRRRTELEPHRAQIKASFAFQADIPVIVFVGKFIERKRPMDLLEAYAAVLRGGTRVGLLLVGDGELRGEMERFIAAHHLHDVKITGFRNQTELPECYVIGDVFVLPARFDTWGLVLNEAMLFGLPVVVSDGVGARLDLVEPDVTGYVYAVGDVNALAAHLQSLIESPELRTRMGRSARERVHRYDYAACARGLADALQTAMSLAQAT